MDKFGIIIGIIAIFIIFSFLKWLFSPKQRELLSKKMSARADWKYSKRLRLFKQKYGRDPTNREKFRIIINASHITIRRPDNKGHWGRQKVRKYLLEKHGVVKKYRMR